MVDLISAKSVQDQINRFANDIKLFWDGRDSRWKVCQVVKDPGGFILPDMLGNYSDTRPRTLFTIQKRDGSYRPPSNQDVSDAKCIFLSSQYAFRQGADRFMDTLEANEQATKSVGDQRITDRIMAYGKDLKKAIRTELVR